MRLWFLVLVSAVVIIGGSCVRRSPGTFPPWLTGTCEGACTHYLSCKDARGDRVGEDAREACMLECTDIFSTEDPLYAFESLGCEEAVAFVEGSSGRVPGARPSSNPSASSAR